MNKEEADCQVGESAPLVEGAPLTCHACQVDLCLRKQVINLALGNTDEMYCLNCLAKDNEQTPEDVLKSLMPYIDQRDCFAKQWQRYLNVEYCPDRQGCLPAVCFASKL